MAQKTVPIQVEQSEQPVVEEGGEHMRDQELAQQIEQLIEVIEMELEQEPKNKDNDLMLRASEVISQSPPPPLLEPIPIEQGEFVILNDNPVMNVYNI